VISDWRLATGKTAVIGNWRLATGGTDFDWRAHLLMRRIFRQCESTALQKNRSQLAAVHDGERQNKSGDW